ncbi:MAG: oligopeptidase A [Lysobacterales bacterium]|nr:MAG: oligopeptidase A [Xanthomonadales bacterium]
MNAENPLLDFSGLPRFAEIRPEHVEPAVDALLAENRAGLAQLLAQPGPYTWANLIEPLEAMQDRLNRAWGPVGHLNAVMNSEALRAAYNACLPKLSAYYTEYNQNEALYRATQAIRDGDEFARLDAAQRKVIDDSLRDFRLAGIALPAEKKARYGEIVQELSLLGAKFSEHVLDATQAWSLHLDSENRLAGLPASALGLARQAAAARGLDGWLLTLEFPSYQPVMSYAQDRSLRESLYFAYATRAAGNFPAGAQWDNTAVVGRILELRHELARLLDFPDYAQYSLATKMADDPATVLDFLRDLGARARPQAGREFEELSAFARERLGLEKLEAWDVGYASEQLKQARYAISDEELRPYFPETSVVPGLFQLVEKLFGVSIRAADKVEVWHPDVRAYDIFAADGALRARFYFDLYARANKRGGAWMDSAIARRRTADGLQLPVAYMVCNFTPPVGDDPALFTHAEVQTLFHEFGHGLHHMLTTVDYAAVSGISGVEWDAVELPSQFMENFCWERVTLDLIAGHYRTREPIPEALYERMIAAKNFQSAMITVRQLEFGLFDLRLHREYDPARGARVLELLEEVRDEVAVVRPPAFNRYPMSFSHIFAGGYAAGYYSYKWAEVLSADAFGAFEEAGVFDAETGCRFLTEILEVGGSRPALESFMAFRGRRPEIDALLRHSGIAA